MFSLPVKALTADTTPNAPRFENTYTNTKNTTEAVPIAEPPEIPIRINPTCAMEENARNRFILFCRMANRLPTIIVSTEIKNNKLYQVEANGLKTVYNTEANTKMIAPFEITDR